MMRRKLASLLAILLLLPTLAAAAPAEEPVTQILLSDEGTRVEGEGAAAYGSVVTVYSGGTYSLSGEFHGQLIVDTQKNKGHVTLILDGARIICGEGPALWVEKARSCRLLLNPGTDNEISSEAAENCAVYANKPLLIDGVGSLMVRAADGDGFYCRKDLSVQDGLLTVQADRRGLHTRKHLEIGGGELTVSAGRKGLSANESMAISGGKLRILAGGDGISVGKRGDQYKEDVGVLTLSGGEISIDAYKAPIDAWGGMTVLGGTCFGTGRTDKLQRLLPDSTQATVVKISRGDPGDRVVVEDAAGVLGEAVPQYAYTMVIFTDQALRRGFQYIVTSPRVSYPVRAK